MKKIIMAGSLITMILLSIICLWESPTKKSKIRPAGRRTVWVAGLLAYNVDSDIILEVPEEYFLTLDPATSYDEVVSQIGKPSGTIGSGFVRDYWRIGKNTYAVCMWGYERVSCEIENNGR